MSLSNLKLARHLSSLATQGNSTICGPAVKLLLIHYGLENRKIEGSGPKKNILKSDVLNIVNKEKLKPVVHQAEPVKTTASATSAPQKAAQKIEKNSRLLRNYQDIPVSQARAVISTGLEQAKRQIPHEYHGIDVQIDKISQFIDELKSKKIDVSLEALILKAAAIALRSVPEINVLWTESGILKLGSVDVAVTLQTQNRLSSPVVSNVDVKGALHLTETIKKLQETGTGDKASAAFSLVNLGSSSSVSNFTAVIGQNQSAVLTVGGVRNEVVSRNGTLESQKLLGVTLCFDGRAIGEESAKKYLVHLANGLSDPDLLIAEPLSPELDFDFARLL